MTTPENENRSEVRRKRRGINAMVVGSFDYYCYNHEIANCSLSNRVVDRRRKRRSGPVSGPALPSPFQCQAEVEKREEFDPSLSE
eukprot:CAMPEP_0197462064 /NCGR_PEP_ID=MMETSP1175-20131217/58142_1 /TAXON_ID=1003142 /ORGANISM="Triceratium dubium, Strain CCMP147" /LENGTH=84 /DNA_ID=CAMNT_0042997479 /DNA_START=74 /DNA_END=325 /DNA_ORIENTATION=+